MKYARKIMSAFGAKALEGSEGLVEAYCSVFNNVDFSGEVIRPGFFADTIAAANTQGKSLPKILWSHSMWDMPLGITKEAEEVLPYDARLPQAIKHLGGLRVVGHFNLETQQGRDAFSHIKFGSLDKYSIGYYVIQHTFDRETGVVELLKGDWLEWSPVNFAANDETITVTAKGGKEPETDEHVYVVRGPAEFVDGSFKRAVKEYANGSSTYTVITGTLRSTGATEEASIRFDADAWSAEDAQSFCDGNSKGTFQAATKSAPEKERLAEQGARMVAQVSAYLDRVEYVKALRIAEGKESRELSEANRNILKGLLPDLQSVSERVQALIDKTEPAAASAGKDAQIEAAAATSGNGRAYYARMLSMEAELLVDDA